MFKPNQKLVKIIAIGNEQYFKDLGSVVRRNVLALRAVFNPFGRSFSIHSLPYQTRKVTFLLYDLLGKVAWQKEILDIHPGPSLMNVDRMLATGLSYDESFWKIRGTQSVKQESNVRKIVLSELLFI